MDEKIKKEFEDIEREFQNVRTDVVPERKVSSLKKLISRANLLLLETNDLEMRRRIDFLIEDMKIELDNEIKLTRDNDKKKSKKVNKRKNHDYDMDR